ncbi:MAG: iron-containing alcohol dehydrogenase [Pseudomonadales bacterium]
MAKIDFLSPQDWTFPVPIAYGPGRLKEIANHCQQAGMQRPLIVTDSGSAKLDFVTQAAEYLKDAGLQTAIYSNISPNPRDDEIAAGRAQYITDQHHGIVAIGGGSGMDGGKAICLTANNELDLWRFNIEQETPELAAHSFPPLITIPTTAGTGAETESTGMITDTIRGMKLCIWHPRCKPSTTLLDPEITIGLPSNLTAWTGCDAMIHAIEAYCVPNFHPLCDGVALEGLRLIHQWLPAAVANGNNLEARGAMLVGSCLAGIAFLKGLGVVHAISHMVGAQYDTHHGLTNSIVLPAALRFNQAAMIDKLPALAAAMQLDNDDFGSFYSAVCDRLDALSIPKNLTDIGVPGDCAKEMAERAALDAAAATNIRSLSVSEIQTIIEEALHKGR